MKASFFCQNYQLFTSLSVFFSAHVLLIIPLTRSETTKRQKQRVCLGKVNRKTLRLLCVCVCVCVCMPVGCRSCCVHSCWSEFSRFGSVVQKKISDFLWGRALNKTTHTKLQTLQQSTRCTWRGSRKMTCVQCVSLITFVSILDPRHNLLISSSDTDETLLITNQHRF